MGVSTMQADQHRYLSAWQRIGVEGATSLSQLVLLGVPQGSVLGPLLLYIDGLTNALSNSSMSLYADDLLLSKTI